MTAFKARAEEVAAREINEVITPAEAAQLTDELRALVRGSFRPTLIPHPLMRIQIIKLRWRGYVWTRAAFTQRTTYSLATPWDNCKIISQRLLNLCLSWPGHSSSTLAGGRHFTIVRGLYATRATGTRKVARWMPCAFNSA